MITEFSPPYHVTKTGSGFVVMNAKGGHEALFSNRGEAEEIASMMNQTSEFRKFLLFTARGNEP